MLATKEILQAGYRKPFDSISKLTPSCEPIARIAFCVFVG